MKRKDVRMHNVLFPIWMLIWFPSWLWLILIPANYIVDYTVFYFSQDCNLDRKGLSTKHAWKMCIAGFLGDFLGALLLFITQFIDVMDFSNAVVYNPFENIFALLFVLFCVFVSGATIYYLDLLILKRT